MSEPATLARMTESIEPRPVLRTSDNDVTLMGRSAHVTVEYHDDDDLGLRTVTTTYIEGANIRSEGGIQYPPGTVHRRLVEGDARLGEDAFTVHEDEVIYPPDPETTGDPEGAAEPSAFGPAADGHRIEIAPA